VTFGALRHAAGVPRRTRSDPAAPTLFGGLLADLFPQLAPR
jgi:hypothetical protein